MKIETTADAIRNRLEALHLRHAIAFQYHTPPKGDLIEGFAEELDERLEHDDELAVIILRALINPEDLATDARFWKTPLGRLLFAAGGFLHETISQSDAAGVLRLSRQRVHQLVQSGRLRSAPADDRRWMMVRSEDVRLLLRSQLDKHVK